METPVPSRRSRGRFQYRWGRLSRAARNIDPNMHPAGSDHTSIGMAWDTVSPYGCTCASPFAREPLLFVLLSSFFFFQQKSAGGKAGGGPNGNAGPQVRYG